MCGVAGIYNYGSARPIDEPLLARMTRLLAHRGPDGEGFFVRGPLGFGHRRLAIVDLTPNGAQPMQRGSHVMSYNGEIYNHGELRRALEQDGVRFRGRSDTETLLQLLAHRGPDALRDVAGIFALAHWDMVERRLILARDPLGVKQLYYYDDGERLLFASEIKALLACASVARDIDHAAVNEYLHFHTPLFERTFFRAVRQVKPAQYHVFQGTKRRAQIYWHVHGAQPMPARRDEHVEALRALVGDVVRDQLQSDVQVGAFLSGGLDSSSIAAVARQHVPNLACFGSYFDHPSVIDERPFQRETAQKLGVDLQLSTITDDTFPDDFMRLTYFQDQPVAGPAMLPMFAVSKLAAAQVKVCLGGQASDEIFAGYARYSLAQPWRTFGSAVWGAASRRFSGSAVTGTLHKQLDSRRNVLRLARAMLVPQAAQRYFTNFAAVRESVWRGLGADAAWMSRERAETLFCDTVARSPAQNVGDKILHWDVQTYLPGLFQQDDRMSMANSLESRVPLADPRLVQFAFRTPFDMKIRGGASKWILREAMAPLLPAASVERRKVGFDTPVGAWLAGPQRDFVRDLLLSQRARERGLFCGKRVEAFLDSAHPHWFDVVWKLASVEAWQRTFVDSTQSIDRRLGLSA